MARLLALMLVSLEGPMRLQFRHVLPTNVKVKTYHAASGAGPSCCLTCLTLHTHQYGCLQTGAPAAHLGPCGGPSTPGSALAASAGVACRIPAAGPRQQPCAEASAPAEFWHPANMQEAGHSAQCPAEMKQIHHVDCRSQAGSPDALQQTDAAGGHVCPAILLCGGDPTGEASAALEGPSETLADK